MQQPSLTPGTDLGTSIALKYGLKRSSLWPGVQRAFLAKNGQCAVCPGNTTIQIHHVMPFHFCHLVYRGDLELDQRNFIPLCEESGNNHHLLLGHLGDFESYNQGGRESILALGKSIPGLGEAAIKADQAWILLMGSRPKPWEKWTHAEKLAFRQILDTTLPFIPSAKAPAPYPFLDDGTANPQAVDTTYH
jgi:hypothetical protein